MDVINYGGIITRLSVPDRNGVVEDVVLGFDTLEEYVDHNPYFGAIIGRYGNRIGNGKFIVDGKAYHLAQNNNGQHLHGGIVGFDKKWWHIEEVFSPDGASLQLTYVSKDGEEGYPGDLSVEVTYILSDGDEIKIDIRASTNKKTIVNLTTHSYFNLTGNCKRDILDHQLQLNAEQFVPVAATLIPTGNLMPVANTPFDFRSPEKIGARINDAHEQLTLAAGYDHTFVTGDVKTMKTVAIVVESVSGRCMEVQSTEPGLQFYTGNFLQGAAGKNGAVYLQRFGFCLETQHYPDSPNQPHFPSVMLTSGEHYHTQTVYRFYTK